MKKTILKSACVAVAAAASSFGAWKAYDAYQYEDNAMLMENVEALTQNDGDNPGLLDGVTSWGTMLASGVCGVEVGIYRYSWTVGESGTSVSVEAYSDPMSGKLLNVSNNQEFQLPSTS